MTTSAQDQRIIDLIHDLRNPLSVVQGFAELLIAKADTISREDLTSYATRIERAASEMNAILTSTRPGS